MGRRSDLATITRLLSEARVVTLSGVGGVGKSRLAVRVAAGRERAFPDGVWLIELGELADPRLLAQTIVGTLRIQDRVSRPAADVLTEYLRDKRILVILDNCEHLLEECAVLVASLVRSAPMVRVLATSREPLGIAAEQTYVVPPLPLPDDRRPAGAPADAVELFTDRARRVVPDFTLTEADRGPVERICRHLDGIPLGIELAAIQLRALSLQELEARLRDRFGLLTRGAREAPPRHRTLRAVMDWSYGLCSPAERSLWERCCVFAGRLDLAAAEAVCPGDGIAQDEILELVRRLVDKSILARDDQHGYRMLETIRQYGLERLAASGRTERWRLRHRDYYRELAAVHGGRMFSPEQTAGRLQQVQANLRIALETCFTDPDGAEDGLAMAAALFPLWISGPQLSEGRHWLARGLAEVRRPGPARAHALWVGGWLAVVQTDVAAADTLLSEARTLGARLRLPAVRGYAALCEGMVAMYRGDAETAIERYEEALAHHRAGGEPMGVALALIWVCLACSLQGDSPRAVAAGEASLALCDEHGDRWIRAYALMALGVEMTRQGRWERAAELTRQSLKVHHTIDDRLGIAFTVEVLAWIAAGQGKFTRAATLSGVLRTLRQTAEVMPPEYVLVLRHYEDSQARTQQALGRRSFKTALARGTALGPDEAIAYALEEPVTEETPPRPAAALPPLTPRETEVARLAARGLTNQQIADELTVARRTAETHVANIMTKLGCTSRWQITPWLEEQGLSPASPLDGHASGPPSTLLLSGVVRVGSARDR